MVDSGSLALLGLDQKATLPVGSFANSLELRRQGFNGVTETAVQQICSQTSLFAQVVCTNILAAPAGSGLLAPFFSTNLPQTCKGTRYGCCGDGKDGTARYSSQVTRLNPEGTNCSREIVCKNSPFGCCKGTKIPLQDISGSNCPQTISFKSNDDDPSKLDITVQRTSPGLVSNLDQFSGTIPAENISDLASIVASDIVSDTQCLPGQLCNLTKNNLTPVNTGGNNQNPLLQTNGVAITPSRRNTGGNTQQPLLQTNAPSRLDNQLTLQVPLNQQVQQLEQLEKLGQLGQVADIERLLNFS